jgi:hypothetical protein
MIDLADAESVVHIRVRRNNEQVSGGVTQSFEPHRSHEQTLAGSADHLAYNLPHKLSTFNTKYCFDNLSIFQNVILALVCSRIT